MQDFSFVASTLRYVQRAADVFISLPRKRHRESLSFFILYLITAFSHKTKKKQNKKRQAFLFPLSSKPNHQTMKLFTFRSSSSSNSLLSLKKPNKSGKTKELALGRSKSTSSNSLSSLTTSCTEHEIRALFYLWNEALATGDSAVVTARYAKGATLLPTLSDIPRTDEFGIKDYFDHFLLNKPQGRIIQGHVYLDEQNGMWAKDIGIYEFTMGTTGAKARARYTFVYIWDQSAGEWKITHHHSSLMPEKKDEGRSPPPEKVQKKKKKKKSAKGKETVAKSPKSMSSKDKCLPISVAPAAA